VKNKSKEVFWKRWKKMEKEDEEIGCMKE